MPTSSNSSLQTLTIHDAVQLAVQAHRSGNVQQAEQLYRAILAKDPNHADAAHNLGVLAMQCNRVRDALPLFQTAINARPQQMQFWKSAINALYEMSAYAKCAEICTQYLELNPNDADIMAELVRANLMQLGNNVQGVPDSLWQMLRKALELQPESSAVHRNLARLHLKDKQPQEALMAAEKACRLDPAHQQNQLVLISALLSCGRTPEAQTALAALLKSHPHYAEALSMNALMLSQENHLDESVEYLHKALALRPENFQSLYLLGAILLKQHKRVDAIKISERCLQLKPEDIHMLSSLAELYRLELRYEESGALLNRALQLEPNNVSALTNLAVLMQSMTHVDKAVTLYQRVLQLEPGKTTVVHNLAMLLLEQGNHEQAAQLFERILGEEPRRAVWRLHLFQALTATLALERAQEVALELEADPDLMQQLTNDDLATLTRTKELLAERANSPQAAALYMSRIAGTHARAREACAPLPKELQGTCPITALLDMGRSGTLFFHSLMDGHPELVTLPGVYFAGWFTEENIKRFQQDQQDAQWREHLVGKILDAFEPQFNAHSTKNTSGKAFGNCSHLAESSGFTSMGPNRDTVFVVDKDLVAQHLLDLLRPLPTVSHARCFELIHHAYSRAAGQQQWQHTPTPHIFYHIHNPDNNELESFLRHYPQANVLKLTRHPIQGLESWMNIDIAGYEKLLDDPQVASNANLLDSSLTANWQKAAGKASTRIHPVQDAYCGIVRGITVRIEDVKRRPHDIMPKIAAWMGLADHQSLYESTFNGIQYWGPASLNTKAITGFDTAAIDKSLGRLFGPRDLQIMETLFYPQSVAYGYAEADADALQQNLTQIDPWLDEPLEFELNLYRKLREPNGAIQAVPAYKNLHFALRSKWNVLKQGIDTTEYHYPLLAV